MSTDRTVYLIDTPGFDDTKKSDTEVLSEIALWLGDLYKNKILLNENHIRPSHHRHPDARFGQEELAHVQETVRIGYPQESCSGYYHVR